MNNNDGEKVKQKILALLEKHPEGLTIADVSRALGLHRQTVTKYIFELKGADALRQRQVGPALLHYPTKRRK
jgi:DNA-binding IclR family transcriptional regulator